MDVEIIDLVTCTSQTAATYSRANSPLPHHTFKHLGQYFAMKGEIVVHGGRPDHLDDGYSDQLFALEVEEMTWRKLTAKGKIPSMQSSHMSCVNSCGNSMFVFASYEKAPEVAELYLFDYTLRYPVWSHIRTAGSLLSGIYGGSMDMVNDKFVIVYGGLVDGEDRRELYVYDIASQLWTEGKALPKQSEEFRVTGVQPGKRVRQASVVLSNKILYFGGECEHGEALDDVLVLEL